MAFSRREFLKRLGIGAGALGIGAALPKVASAPEAEVTAIDAEPINWTWSVVDPYDYYTGDFNSAFVTWSTDGGKTWRVE